MKKILFALVALVCSMSMNAQTIEIYKGETLVATYNAKKADRVVFKEAQPEPTTGTAKATINGSEVDVNWVQLWENGPRFAVYNVGAANNNPEDFGGYYCWGKSTDKDQSQCFKSGESALTGTDDTATNLWGSNWRMPTQDELQNLNIYCDQVWTDNYNGTNVKGRIFTGKGDYASSSVFLPAAGLFGGSDVMDDGYVGYYWSSTPGGSLDAECLLFRSADADVSLIYRGGGYSVRAVLSE